MMGRIKLEMKRIENTINRQVTFSKRRNGLIKKAYELSILCDIDIALIIFSPSDRLSFFSGKTRIEDVISRYINLPDQERENAVIFPDQSRRSAIRCKENLVRTLQQLKEENDIALHLTNRAAINSDIEEVEREISRLQQQIQTAEEEIRKYEPDPPRLTSMEEIEACEKHLLDTLTRVVRRREYLLRNNSSSSAGMQQSMAGPYADDVVGWLSEDGPNQAQIFVPSSAPPNQLSVMSSTMYGPSMTQASSSSSNQNNMSECHVSSTGDEMFQGWAQPYTSTAHLPPVQSGMVGPGMPEMTPRQQVEVPVTDTEARADHGASNYEITFPRFGGE